MKGTLMDKETGEPLLIDGKKVTKEVTFTPEKADGSVEMTFTFDGSALAGKTVVAFEDCLRDGKEVAVHHDINSKEQTIDIPGLKTELKDDVTGSHNALAEKEMSLTDIATYTGLIPGKEYTMKGVLMDKTTGEPLLINGERVLNDRRTEWQCTGIRYKKAGAGNGKEKSSGKVECISGRTVSGGIIQMCILDISGI